MEDIHATELPELQQSTPPPAASSEAAPRSVDWSNVRVAAILGAAAKCFSQSGFHSTTLAEIGKELGLRKSIVHYYFASKQALIQEVQSFFNEKSMGRLLDALAAPVSLGQAFLALRASTKEDPTANGLNIELWSAALRDGEVRRRLAAVHSEAKEALAERLQGQTADSAAMATLALAVLDGLTVRQAIDGDNVAADRAFEAFVGLLTGEGARSSSSSNAA